MKPAIRSHSLVESVLSGARSSSSSRSSKYVGWDLGFSVARRGYYIQDLVSSPIHNPRNCTSSLAERTFFLYPSFSSSSSALACFSSAASSGAVFAPPPYFLSTFFRMRSCSWVPGRSLSVGHCAMTRW